MEDVIVEVSVHELEPGTHIARKTIAVLRRFTVTLPRKECLQPVGLLEWDMYFPEINLRFIELALKRRNVFLPLPTNQCYFFGVNANETNHH